MDEIVPVHKQPPNLNSLFLTLIITSGWQEARFIVVTQKRRMTQVPCQQLLP